MRLPVALQVGRVRLLRAGKQRTHISAACCATWRRGRRTPSNCGLPCATTVRLSPDKPRFGRFNYAGKSEYWALVWGTALMGLAGVTIWAKVWVGNLPARWWIDVAPLLRGDPGHACHPGLALLPGLLRSRCIPHELGLVGRQDAGGPLRPRAQPGQGIAARKRIRARGRLVPPLFDFVIAPMNPGRTRLTQDNPGHRLPAATRAPRCFPSTRCVRPSRLPPAAGRR